MKVYRVHVRGEDGESGGYSFFGSRRDAEAEATRWVNLDHEVERPAVERLDVPSRKRDLLEWLDRYAGHADNG